MTFQTKIATILVLPLLSLAPFAIAQVQTGTAPQTQYVDPFTDRTTVVSDLARIDNALNSTSSFFGRFQQTGTDGTVDKGAIYIKRPGKMRFEYDQPNPLLIISDGVTLLQQDRALETADRVPLSATPLNFFLKEDVNLARDTEVIGLIKTPTEMRVTARDGSCEIEGDITLVFDARSLALKGWFIADSFGGVTQISLSELQYNKPINPRLFIIRGDDRRDRRR